jgi:RNA polymerase sigma-70 factor (ECF subfamily)
LQALLEFEQIYKTHKDLVYNLALHYTQIAEDAEEIAQDVFVNIYNNSHKFKGESTIKTWVYKITVNKSLDFIKAKQRKKRSFWIGAQDIQSPLTLAPAETMHPGVILEEKEAMGRVFRAINELPERQKTALILLKIEQQSPAEVQDIMELKPKALESLIHRAKQNLEKILNKTNDTNEGVV